MRALASGATILVSGAVALSLVASRLDHARAAEPQATAQTQPATKEQKSRPPPVPRSLSRAMAERGDLQITDVSLNPMLRFEMKQAEFLHRMTIEKLRPDPQQAQALALVFANYIRRTVEERPRPILVGYPEPPPVQTQGADIVLTPGYQTENQVDANGRPLYLVVQAIAVLRPEQVKPFRATIERWKMLRQGITDGPLKRLYRSLFDPQLALPKEKLAVLIPMLQDSIEGLSSLERRQRDRMIKIEKKTRAKIFKELTPDQQRHAEKVIQMLQDDSARWEQPGHAEQIYIDAVRLEQSVNAKQKSTPD